jgi:hypothetical protein
MTTMHAPRTVATCPADAFSRPWIATIIMYVPRTRAIPSMAVLTNCLIVMTTMTVPRILVTGLLAVYMMTYPAAAGAAVEAVVGVPVKTTTRNVEK